jgi:hypothetical protein
VARATFLNFPSKNACFQAFWGDRKNKKPSERVKKPLLAPKKPFQRVKKPL